MPPLTPRPNSANGCRTLGARDGNRSCFGMSVRPTQARLRPDRRLSQRPRCALKISTVMMLILSFSPEHPCPGFLSTNPPASLRCADKAHRRGGFAGPPRSRDFCRGRGCGDKKYNHHVLDISSEPGACWFCESRRDSFLKTPRSCGLIQSRYMEHPPDPPPPEVRSNTADKEALLARFLGPVETRDAEVVEHWRQASAADHARAMIDLADTAEQIVASTGFGKPYDEQFPGFPKADASEGGRSFAV